MGIESIATGTVTGLLAFVFFYVFKRTKEADERRDEGSDMVRSGLQAELARANARADGLVRHYEDLLTEQHRCHVAEIQRLTEQWERDRAWLSQKPATNDDDMTTP